VISADGAFRSPALDENDTYQFKFDRPGVYKYLCSIHPKMMATITVK
jgi:plastocyanin